MPQFEGRCNLELGSVVTGWVRRLAGDQEPVGVEVCSENGFQGFVTAALPRSDSPASGFSFRCELPAEIIADGVKVQVRVSGSDFEFPNSPLTMWKNKTVMDTLQVTPLNIQRILSMPAKLAVRYLLLDPIDTCNAHCLYCPNARTNTKINLDNFESLLEKLEPPNVFQLGCGQEPTVDARLPRFFELIGASRNKPAILQMITNGMLLDRYDASVFVANGLEVLMLSLDTCDPLINDTLRLGTKLSKILSNIRQFRQQCPKVRLTFSTVVSTATIDKVHELVLLGQDLGVSLYFFREVSDYSTNPRDPRYLVEMPRLVLQPGQFQQMQTRLTERWPSGPFRFLSRSFIDHRRTTVRSAWNTLSAKA
jgi:sulfatase maturation enzyme AslB (radical SAM superfamily)